MGTFKKTLLGALLAVAATAGSAYAVPVTGQISIKGDASYDANSVTFVAGSGVASSGTQLGDFKVIGNTFNVTLGSFAYDPALDPAPVTIFSATNSGGTATATFSLATISSHEYKANSSLNIIGTGTLSLTDFEPTMGTFMFSTQGDSTNVAVTFSATAVAAAVPEPASIALIGAGLVALGLARRRSGQSAV